MRDSETKRLLAWLRERWVAATLLAISALSLALLLPPALNVGWTLEEIATVLPVAPHWEYPTIAGPAPTPAEDLAAGVQLYSEPRRPLTLPVWGLVSAERFYPLMVDGHIGALPGYPYRWATDLWGLDAARIMTVLGGLGMVLMVFALGRALFGPAAGLLGAGLLATSPLFLFAHSWTNQGEQWSSWLPGLALLALIRFHRTERTGWLLAGALLAGFGVASKNTAVWTVFAGLGAAACFRLLPRVSLRQAAAAVLCGTLPMVPQLLFMFRGTSAVPLSDRLARIPAPWEAFTPERLLDIGRHYVEAFTAWTDFGVPLIRSGVPLSRGALPAVGAILLLGTAAVVTLAFRRGLPRPARAFGLGFGLLLLQYAAFYYMGQSAFLLLLPWVPLGLAGVATTALDRVARLARPARRRLGVGTIIACLALLLVNQGVKTAVYEETAANTNMPLWDRSSQLGVAGELTLRDIDQPWTTTYAIGGVLEVLTDGGLRPRHAYPFFAWACGATEPGSLHAAWLEVFTRMGPGLHHVLLSPRSSKVEVSPCESGELIVETFHAASREAGLTPEVVRRFRAADGAETFRLVALRIPTAEAEAADGQTP